MFNGVEVIAEVKTNSPFGFESKKSWSELFDIATSVGDMISVHTDPRWGGSFGLVSAARSRTNLPILAKGIHESDDEIKMALDAGADSVLVVGRVPGVHEERCLIEPRTLKELRELPTGVRAVWNSRNLITGKRKRQEYKEARQIFGGWLCQASNIRTVDDIESGANAALVGEHLENFAKSLTNKYSL